MRVYHGLLMDSFLETLFDAKAGDVLVDALVAALADEKQPPSREDVASWIVEGRVCVEDVVVRDPERVLAGGEEVELSAWAEGAVLVEEPVPEPVEEPPPVEVDAIRHIDQHMLVVDYAPPARGGASASTIVDYLNRMLVQAGMKDVTPVPFPEHEARASGIVAAGLVPHEGHPLDEGSRPLGVRIAAKALVPETDGADLDNLTISHPAPGLLLVRTPPAESSVNVLADLRARNLDVLEAEGDGPVGHRPLLLHVVGLALTHPRTGHTQMWSCTKSPLFDAALEKAKARATGS
jgi:hypothetical protein